MSLPRDPRCCLWDALRATESVQTFVRGKTYESFSEDDLVRSAVERQLQIIGEAFSQLARTAPQMADKVAELRRVIAFRNVLVHGYAAIDYDTVWRLIQDKLPELQVNLRVLLDAADTSPDPPACRTISSSRGTLRATVFLCASTTAPRGKWTRHRCWTSPGSSSRSGIRRFSPRSGSIPKSARSSGRTARSLPRNAAPPSDRRATPRPSRWGAPRRVSPRLPAPPNQCPCAAAYSLSIQDLPSNCG